MKTPPVQSKTVLVTGCSSGIGLATARVLRDRGWKVVPTARKPKDLGALGSEGFHPVQLDVADSASVKKAVDDTLEIFEGGFGALVNNAGYGQPGALEDLSRDVLRHQFDVNVVGMQDLTNQLIPVFRKQGYGRIVNISSVVGRISLPFMGAYSATKFAMEALSDALRIELHDTGIGVSIVEPGPIESAFLDNAQAYASNNLDPEASCFGDEYKSHILERKRGDKPTDKFTLPPEAVAEKVLHALESDRPRTRYPVTIPAYLGSFLRRIAPDGLVDSILRSRITRQRKG